MVDEPEKLTLNVGQKMRMLYLLIIPLTFLGALTVTSYSLGFPTQANQFYIIVLLKLLSYVSILIIYIVCGVKFICQFRRKRGPILPLVVLVTISTAIGFCLTPISLHSYHAGIQNDLLDRDLKSIRQEVAELLMVNIDGNSTGYFGKLIPTNMIPHHLNSLGPPYTIYERTFEGVVVRTDGLGSWRGGFLFLPTTQTSDYKNARFIMPSVYYVMSR